MKSLPISLEDLVILCFWDEDSQYGREFRDLLDLTERAFIMATFLGDNSDFSVTNCGVRSTNIEMILDKMAEKGIITRKDAHDGRGRIGDVDSYSSSYRDYSLIVGKKEFDDLAGREPEIFKKVTELFDARSEIFDNPTEAVIVLCDILSRNQSVNKETIREGIINTLFEPWLNEKRSEIGAFLDGFDRTNAEEV